jgi:hypothetical protein
MNYLACVLALLLAVPAYACDQCGRQSHVSVNVQREVVAPAPQVSTFSRTVTRTRASSANMVPAMPAPAAVIQEKVVVPAVAIEKVTVPTTYSYYRAVQRNVAVAPAAETPPMPEEEADKMAEETPAPQAEMLSANAIESQANLLAFGGRIFRNRSVTTSTNGAVDTNVNVSARLFGGGKLFHRLRHSGTTTTTTRTVTRTAT